MVAAEAEPELSVMDMKIRHLGNAVTANEQMAEHFTELAADEQTMLDYWTQERSKFLAGAGLENVVEFRPIAGRHEPGFDDPQIS